ncbi:Purine nucleoside phosphorylase [Cryptotermes secundus]|uniref:Purine nucleoside phosphorylase n=1 Tax=Cryptotermes secundus TaxID=105785 RepID=A0A2J7QGQ8_9NEOP|nr:purine nucleoside phosphorylase isoform X2 [Cryptotermes secundus]PNF27771.1 Purine nucleoside phosphorylase [Cryptotermes secundus]
MLSVVCPDDIIIVNACGGPCRESYTYDDVQETSVFLLRKTKYRPAIGIICGSGLGSLADSLTDKECFPYEDVPHFPVSTVRGHTGQLVFGLLDGVPVMCMQGRFHYYEGYPICKCAMPVRVMKMVGVKYLIATNAAGGLNEKYKVGDIMVIKDHVNFMGFAGVNPLRGPNDERFGPRFPAVSKAYDASLRAAAMKIGRDLGIEDSLHEGVYTCLGGPNFETVAELSAMKILGIDAVGMSTVHEVIVACHSGMTVFAFSLITNKCVTTYDEEVVANHEEVIEAGREREDVLKAFVSNLVQHIRNNPPGK